jgi:hypothetical protein
MLDSAALRRAFAEFLGSDRYRKFIQQGFRHGRLRFWQEREWERFTAAHPEFAVGAEELADVVRVCYLHGDELQLDTADVYPGCRDFAQWYIDARNRLFPNAATDGVSAEGRLFGRDRVTVWYCPSCRASEMAWRARRASRQW